MFRILLVEDSATQGARMRAILEEAGMSVDLAGNGREAIERMEAQQPDVVVTDLQMPEMNGLELISHMDVQFPLIPSVLITEHGSESLAVDALGGGAASYVAKPHAHLLLAETTALAGQLSAANIEALPLKGTMENRALAYTIDSRCERITALARMIACQLTAISVLHSRDRIRMCMALEYLLFQSIYHGNLEQPFLESPVSRAAAITSIQEQAVDEDFRKRLRRCVMCDIQIEDEFIEFRIEHEGPGRMVSPRSPLPGTPESFEAAQGMLLLTSVMDEVRFNPHSTSAALRKTITG